MDSEGAASHLRRRSRSAWRLCSLRRRAGSRASSVKIELRSPACSSLAALSTVHLRWQHGGHWTQQLSFQQTARRDARLLLLKLAPLCCSLLPCSGLATSASASCADRRRRPQQATSSSSLGSQQVCLSACQHVQPLSNDCKLKPLRHASRTRLYTNVPLSILSVETLYTCASTFYATQPSKPFPVCLCVSFCGLYDERVCTFCAQVTWNEYSGPEPRPRRMQNLHKNVRQTTIATFAIA